MTGPQGADFRYDTLGSAPRIAALATYERITPWARSACDPGTAPGARFPPPASERRGATTGLTSAADVIGPGRGAARWRAKRTYTPHLLSPDRTGRPVASWICTQQLGVVGIDLSKKPEHSGERWTPDQDAQLRREAAGNTPTRVIGIHLGRSEDAVRTRASELDVSLKPVNQSPYGTKKK